MIIEQILKHKQSRISQSPCTVNRASECGHPCERYLVYCRTNWQDRKTFDASVQLIFDIGNDIEARVIKDMIDAGLAVIEQHRHFEWKEMQLTGHIDGKLQVDGKVYPLEIKSMSPFMFKTINTIDDMYHSKYTYMKKYPYQMLAYLLLDNKDKGVFILKNKSTGEMKEVWMDLDYTLGEKLIKKLESVNLHIASGELPERIEYDDSVCGDCPFAHICLKDRKVENLEMSDDPTIIRLLDAYYDLKPIADEFTEVEERVKKELAGKKGVYGKYFVSGKWVEMRKYNVPKEIQEQYPAPSVRYWKREVKVI